MNKRALGSDLAKVDAHEITPEEYEEIPEVDEAFFERAHRLGLVRYPTSRPNAPKDAPPMPRASPQSPRR